MRPLRIGGAVATFLLATVLLLVAVLLGVTLVLLPVSLALGYASFRLYKVGIKLAMPRPADARKALRKQFRHWRGSLRRDRLLR